MSEPLEFVPLTVEELQEFFPQYEILSFIAAGGMGAVYLANQKSIDRRVAIKVLPKEMSSNEEFSSQFRAEATVMSKLNHPNLLGFFDFGQVEDMLFIVMEFVDGKSLHHSAHGEAIEQDTALNLAIGITKGVDHAHSAGILHRDIKPANVLLDQNAFPKLGDFGLARPVEESEAGKVIFGTPGYTAPEVVEDPESIDERSDIYSIGAILYELLTGHLPQKKYLPPSRLRNIDPAFDKVVQKAIAFDPDLRYSNTGSFLKDLKKMKLFHERGHVAPTVTAPISAPKTTADTPEPKLITSTKGKSAKPESKVSSETTPHGGKSKKNLILATAAGIALISIVGIVLSGKKDKSNKEEVLTINKVQPEENDQVTSTKPNAEIEKPIEKTLSPLESLDSLKSSLVRGDLSDLPAGAKVHGNTMRAFFLYDVPRDWRTAQQVAEAYGGYLGCADSSEVRAFLLDQMRGKEKSVWLGGGTAGDSGIKWINGKKWNFPDTDDTVDGYVSLSDNGFINCEDASEKKSFFICWNMDGVQQGGLSQQYFRIKRSAKSENPILPPGAVMTNKSIYMIKMKSVDWANAEKIAKTLNANLAIPNDSVEDTFLSSLVLNGIEEGKGLWMGGTVKPNGTIKWGNQEAPEFDRWINTPEKSPVERGINFVNRDKIGWVAKDKTKKSAGLLLEWSREKRIRPEQVKAPVIEETVDLIPEGYVLELLTKARAANNARKEERTEKQYVNIKEAKSAFSQWIKNLTENDREEVEDRITAFFIKAEDNNFIPQLKETRFPESVKKELAPFLKNQEEIAKEYSTELLELKSAMVKRVETEAGSDTKNTTSLTESANKIKEMSPKLFQKLLDSE